MANARLKLAREKSRKRRRSDAESKEEGSTEVPDAESRAKTTQESGNEAEKTPDEGVDDLKQALLERKTALEARVQALTLGKPVPKLEERGYDANGHRLERAHHDFLLQEMEWMAADFAQERKWRLKSARTLSISVLSHHNKLASRTARAEKTEEERRRRLAARIGRDVKKFWVKIDKIISFKVKLQSDELRKAAMDRHLKTLVAQTERYASALAVAFQEPEPPPSPPDKMGQEAEENSEDSDFKEDVEEVDDETTIEMEEAMASADEQGEELAQLKQEGEMSIEELRAKYAVMDAMSDVAEPGGEDQASDSDFDMSAEEEPDDERTMAEEEQMTSSHDVEEEVALLQEESELSVDELRARYAAAFEASDASEHENEDMVEDSDGEYHQGEEELDDETTVDVAEREEFTREEVDEEVALLQEESELSIDELRAKYAAMMEEEDEVESTQHDEEEPDESDDDDEFEPSEEADDETSIAVEEANTPRTQEDVQDELTTLQEESTLSIEELRARYESEAASPPSSPSPEKRETDEHATDTEAATDEDPSTALEPSHFGYKRPYMLTSRLNLREYQEAGVNWLIQMSEKRLNGILADEMGLGKTIQTITLLAHLASARGVWGPHLIVVPTSCMVNWEMEFKRWCPAFKVLTYYGSAKRRKELRHGWSKRNAFQICITSYQLVVQDAHCFKRKKWYYLILDEAHNIKNWKSLRWQTLLTFHSQRRLLLTGTPLQNNLMELWALMHFLMPHVFASRREFTYWFQTPLTAMVEGEDGPENSSAGNQPLVAQLHGIIRPFVLRRLKKDVAKQMPAKYEHVLSCALSKRQRALYEDFMARSSTRRAMFGDGKKGKSGNVMSMMNVLMQLRKVCNHPDLFEPRPIVSPLDMDQLSMSLPARCAFLVDPLGESKSIAHWPMPSLSLVTQELRGVDRVTSQRANELLFLDDVSLLPPLPSDCEVSTEVQERYGTSQRDVLQRLLRLATQRRKYWSAKRQALVTQSRLHTRIHAAPMLGADLIRSCTMPVFISFAMQVHTQRRVQRRALPWDAVSETLHGIVQDPEERIHAMRDVVRNAVCIVPKARARPLNVQLVGNGFSAADSPTASSHCLFTLSRQRRYASLAACELVPVASRCVNVYYEAFKRTQLFFPDKRLLQFDCGKLQQLALLLRELKRGGHRCLIFTQMSSMLNILEVFLNLHGHTYFRLDGATKVEKRQYLMERFNHDDKVFCFILSTRSGGLGINLTGADCVIFYDSDWNPAMDAQAQDRAHRIGQTRDVHIYRLVSAHTVEENILKRAQQKRHLDFLVMHEGQFTTEFFSKSSLRALVGEMDDAQEEPVDEQEEEEEEDEALSVDGIEAALAAVEDEEDVVAMRGARAEADSEQREFDEEVSGGGGSQRRVSHAGTEVSVDKEDASERQSVASTQEPEEELDEKENQEDTSSVQQDGDSVEEMDVEEDDEEEEEASNEDEEDDEEISDDDDDDELDDEEEAQPARRTKAPAKKRPRVSEEAAVSHKRRRVPTKQDDVSAVGDARKQQRAAERAKERAREMEEERKLQAWKDSVSSLKNFEDSLNPVDRYALHFREEIDPLFTYLPGGQDEFGDDSASRVDIEAIEAQKLVEEAQLIAEGELITGVTTLDPFTPEEVDLHQVFYKKERSHVHYERRRRQLTGTAWQVLKCAITNHPYYYNSDTKEATWDRPWIWLKNEELATAEQGGYAALSSAVLLRVLQYLPAHPDRFTTQQVCRSWLEASRHTTLYTRVNASDFHRATDDTPKRLQDVVSRANKGETIFFGSGVYELDEELHVTTPIQLLAAPDSHVELQMTTSRAQIRWTAHGGAVRGFHITRRHHSAERKTQSSINWQHLLHVTTGGHVRVFFCDFDGNHQGNACVAVSGGDGSSRLVLQHNRIYHAGNGSGVLLTQGQLVMQRNSVHHNEHTGVTVFAGNAVLRRNQIYANQRFGIRLLHHANNVIIEENQVKQHPCGNLDVENSGRRFVVRWNEMNKGGNDGGGEEDAEDDDETVAKLPHFHMTWKLKTSRLEERVLPGQEKIVESPVAASTSVTTPFSTASIVKAVLSSTSVLVPASLAAAVASEGKTLIPTKTETPPVSLNGPKAAPGSTATTAAAASIATSSTLSSAETATAVDAKPKRKRKLKTEKILVPNVVLTFRDTCEKKPEKKVPKPRSSTVKAKATTPSEKEVKTEVVAVKQETTVVHSELRPHLPLVESTEKPAAAEDNNELPVATDVTAPSTTAS